jgi:sugar lactone lactonase YvrE
MNRSVTRIGAQLGLLVVLLLVGGLVVRNIRQSPAEATIASQATVIAANLNAPRAAAIDLNGDCYIADSGSGRILKVSILGDNLASWGVQGSGAGQLRTPGGIAVDADFNVFVADTDNDRIQKFSADGQPLDQWGAAGNGPGQLNKPAGLSVDRQGNVYVADSGNNRIQKFSPTGQAVAQWGSTGTAAGEFQAPEGLALDDQDNVFVADTGNNRIQKLSPQGAPLGWTSTVPFDHPGGLSVDAQGNVYVADGGNNRVVKVGPDGSPLGQLGGQGAQPGQFSNPVDVVRGPGGVLIVVDGGNGRVQVVAPPGSIAARLPTVTPRPAARVSVASKPNPTSTPVPPTRPPTVAPTVVPTTTPVPTDEHWWLTPVGPGVLTEMRGRWYWSEDTSVLAHVGDTVPVGEFEVRRTPDGRWLWGQIETGEVEPACNNRSAPARQTGDTVVIDWTWPGSGTCTEGSATETWTFTRSGASVEVMDIYRDVFADDGGGGTQETHYTGRLMAPGEATPTPKPTVLPA